MKNYIFGILSLTHGDDETGTAVATSDVMYSFYLHAHTLLRERIQVNSLDKFFDIYFVFSLCHCSRSGDNGVWGGGRRETQ